MAFQSQLKTKTTSAKMCRHGAREDCPVAKCRFQHSSPTYIIYSSGLKGAAPPPPTPVTSPIRTHFPSAEQGAFGWCGDGKVHAQHIRPPVESAVVAQGLRDPNGTPFDANALTQATDGLAIYRAWLESQVEVQKAKIQAMSKQYSIPIPQLDLDSLDFPPLGMIPPNMVHTLPTMGSQATVTNNSAKQFRGQHPEIPSTPQAPRLEPMQPFPRAPTTHIPSTNSQYYHEGPTSATPPGAAATLNSSTTTPRKVDMSYKTTPCRHYTLNRGWCPWGDECCFIHDPDLEWVPPAAERGSSGRSTPSSTTLVGGNNYKPVTAVAETGTVPHTSSSQSAHCWGYIQGLCPHSSDNCKFAHPTNIMPYIKYTPCLTWPRCGYPSQECPLKHPQVDKFPMLQSHGQAHGTAPVVSQPQAANVRAPYAGEQHRPLAFPMTADAPFVGASPLIIPHDAAYASAIQYHNPLLPSAETFSPPPRVAVRLSRPSSADKGHAGHVSANNSAFQGDFGIVGVHHGRGRRVSIAVQRPGVELAGRASGHGEEFVRGHGRGRSMQL